MLRPHQIDLASGTFTPDYRSGSPCSALYRKIATADNCGARKKEVSTLVSTDPVVAELERVTQ